MLMSIEKKQPLTRTIVRSQLDALADISITPLSQVIADDIVSVYLNSRGFWRFLMMPSAVKAERLDLLDRFIKAIHQAKQSGSDTALLRILFDSCVGMKQPRKLQQLIHQVMNRLTQHTIPITLKTDKDSEAITLTGGLMDVFDRYLSMRTMLTSITHIEASDDRFDVVLAQRDDDYVGVKLIKSLVGQYKTLIHRQSGFIRELRSELGLDADSIELAEMGSSSSHDAAVEASHTDATDHAVRSIEQRGSVVLDVPASSTHVDPSSAGTTLFRRR